MIFQSQQVPAGFGSVGAGLGSPSLLLETRKFFDADLARVYLVLQDIESWPDVERPRLVNLKHEELLTFAFEDLTRATLTFSSVFGGKQLVSLQHEAILDAEGSRHWAEYWTAVLTATSVRLGSEDIVVASAPGKINLYFGVGSLRADGYHDVASVYQAVDIRETVIVNASSEWKISVEGSLSPAQLAEVPTGPENLVVRAAGAVAKAAKLTNHLPAEFDIEKRVPVAGGMGGGSADAAATLVAINDLWCTALNEQQLHEAAGQLGADVPFALLGGTAVGLGKGEQLEIVPSAELNWVLVTSDAGLSTPEVFARLDEIRAERGIDVRDLPSPEVSCVLLEALAAGNPFDVAEHLLNDLQEAAISLRPELGEIIDAGIGAGALAGLVSGSGPTVAFLAASTEAAAALAQALAATGLNPIQTVGPAAGARLEN